MAAEAGLRETEKRRAVRFNALFFTCRNEKDKEKRQQIAFSEAIWNGKNIT